MSTPDNPLEVTLHHIFEMFGITVAVSFCAFRDDCLGVLAESTIVGLLDTLEENLDEDQKDLALT